MSHKEIKKVIKVGKTTLFTGHLLMGMAVGGTHVRQTSFTIDAPFKAERTMNLTVWPYSKENLKADPPFHGSFGPTFVIYDVTVYAVGTTQTGFKVSVVGQPQPEEFEVFLDYIVIV